jgi:hypothetical protein
MAKLLSTRQHPSAIVERKLYSSDRFDKFSTETAGLIMEE